MFYSAFILGLAGSLHCFGMCGPISMLLPADRSKRFSFIVARLVYNFGRISTYSILGLLIGVVGENLAAYIPQKLLFIGLGLIVLLYLLFPTQWNANKKVNSVLQRLNRFIKHNIHRLVTKHGLGVQFLFGMVNGLVPCGLVYAALSAAFLTTKISDGVWYMVFFGIGTLPMMLAFGWIGNWLPKFLSVRPQFIYRVTYLILGVFLLYKGFTVPISYYANSHEMTVCIGK